MAEALSRNTSARHDSCVSIRSESCNSDACDRRLNDCPVARQPAHDGEFEKEGWTLHQGKNRVTLCPQRKQQWRPGPKKVFTGRSQLICQLENVILQNHLCVGFFDMRWSKLKKKVESNFADSIRSKVFIHSTAYGACTCGHAWLTLDGEVIANFCTRAFYNRFHYGDKENETGLNEQEIKRHKNQYVEYGEISRQDVYESCWAFVHDLAFNDALNSKDPLIQTLAVMDKRLGRRRYDKVKQKDLHPLARKLFETRLSCEQVST